jgi:hypothetical protein
VQGLKASVANSHHFDDDTDHLLKPDLYPREKSVLDLHQNEYRSQIQIRIRINGRIWICIKMMNLDLHHKE